MMHEKRAPGCLEYIIYILYIEVYIYRLDTIYRYIYRYDIGICI